jgi:hypothetical protein
MQSDIVKQPKKEEAQPANIVSAPAEQAKANNAPANTEKHQVLPQDPGPASGSVSNASQKSETEQNKPEVDPAEAKQKNPKKSGASTTLPIVAAVIVCLVLVVIAVYTQMGTK